LLLLLLLHVLRLLDGALMAISDHRNVQNSCFFALSLLFILFSYISFGKIGFWMLFPGTQLIRDSLWDGARLYDTSTEIMLIGVFTDARFLNPAFS
jgi:hypothetical protein